MSDIPDPDARSYATLALVESMTRLHAISPEGLTPVLQHCWEHLERLAVDMMTGANLSLFTDRRANRGLEILLSRSVHLLSMLPDQSEPIAHISTGVSAAMLEWISHDHLALAIRKGIYPANVALLIEHKPGDPKWDHLLCDVLSPRLVKRSGSRTQPFVLSAEIGQVKNIDRLALFLQAEASFHPEQMADSLSWALIGRASYPAVALALILAGARLENAPTSPTPSKHFAHLAQQASSNHGRLLLAQQSGSLTEVLSRLNDHQSASDWAASRKTDNP